MISDSRVWCSRTTSRSGGRSWTWRRSRSTPGVVSPSGIWQPTQTCGQCSTTSSGTATRRTVSPRWPIWPPGFLPLRRRKLLLFRANPSLEGGLLLLWLSFAYRASNSRTRSCTVAFCASTTASCWRCCAFSAFRAAISSSGIMPLCYTYTATLPELSPLALYSVLHA